MKVKLRTLKQEKYEIEIDPQEKVSRLKEMIEERYQIEKSWQILIFSGKVLNNDSTIESCKIEEKDFLVLMVKKPAETEKPAEPKAAQPTPAQATPVQPTPTQSTPAPAQPQPQPSTPQPQVLPSAPLVDESAIAKLCDMGFPRDQAEAALRAAFGNTDRAVDYLFNGIPDGLQAVPPPAQNPQPTQPQPQPQPQPTPSQAQPAPPSGARPGVFDALKSHPQFPALCKLAQEGGEDALKQILTYFAETNPELIRTIQQNQAEFIKLLNEPIPNAPGGAPQRAGGDGVIRLQVTPQDEQIIANFVGMGFDRNRVLEAYFLFDKDQAMTAEYLFNNMNDDDVGVDFGTGGNDGAMYGDEDDEEFDDDNVGGEY